MAAGSFYYFRHYQVDEGLLHNNVTCILQDRLGFIWMGTRAGLNRFDGYTFKSYTTDRSRIGSNYIRALKADKNGLIWIGTSAGLFTLDPATEQVEPVKKLDQVNVRDFVIDSKNNIWVLSGRILHKYDQRAQTVTDFNMPAIAIDIDHQDNIWMGTVASKLKKLNTKTNQITEPELTAFPDMGSRHITKIKVIGQTVFVGTIDGLYYNDLKSRQCRRVALKNKKGTEIFVRDIFPSQQENIMYIATESGLYIYDTQSEKITHLEKVPADPYSLNDNAIYAVFEDNREGVWLGTFFGGLNYFSKENNQFEKYYPLNIDGSISGNAVREICGDRFGNIWIGTEDAGINMLDIQTGRFLQISRKGPSRGPSYPNIHGLLIHHNKLFVGPFFHGLEVIDISTGKIIDQHTQIPYNGDNVGNIVMSIFKTSDNKILVGTTGSGLFEYNELTRQLTPVIYIPGDSYVYAIEEDHEGTIWTGSLVKGVFYYNPRTGRSGNINFSGLKDSTRNAYSVQGIYEDRHYNIWLATEGGGLFKISPERKLVKRYTVKDGLPTNSLYRILEDAGGNLWISTLKGLVCFNPAAESFQTYTKANGLITDQFNFNSAYKDANGKMYFGTVKGMIAFQPETLVRSKMAPPIYITGFLINYETPVSANYAGPKQSILFTDSITLTHLQTTFSIEFAALDFATSNAVQYKYKMEGIDKHWTYLSSNRRAYFTDLPAGTYTFKVQAESNLGDWISAPRTVLVTILPPFWKSTTALVLYAVLILLAVFFAFYIHHKNLKKKNEHRLKLFELEKEKEVYNTKMNFFINIAHEIKTPLTLIKGPVEWALSQINNITAVKRNLELVNKSADRLVALTSQLLDFRKMETNQFNLKLAPANINTIVTNAVAFFKAEIEKRNILLKISLPSKTVEALLDEEAFLKIIHNLMSNAIKYSNRMIEVRLLTSGSQKVAFKLQFINDGPVIPGESRKKIFDPFYRVPSQSHVQGTGIGLALARSLTELHKGTIAYREEDGFNIFELTLPLYQNFTFNNAIENIHEHETVIIDH